MTERSAFDLLSTVARLVTGVYTLLPRPTGPPPDHRTLPPEAEVDESLWTLIDALGPAAAEESGEVWTGADTSAVYREGVVGLHLILRRWNENFHRRRHALPGEEGYEA